MGSMRKSLHPCTCDRVTNIARFRQTWRSGMIAEIMGICDGRFQDFQVNSSATFLRRGLAAVPCGLDDAANFAHEWRDQLSAIRRQASANA